MLVARTVTLRSGHEAAPSTSFFVSWRAVELVLAVKMRPVAPAWAKALAIATPILRLAPMIATTKEGRQLLVGWGEGFRRGAVELSGEVQAISCRRSHF